jgi:hypothetical protein
MLVSETNNEGGDRVGIILEAIANIKTLTQNNNCQFLSSLAIKHHKSVTI